MAGASTSSVVPSPEKSPGSSPPKPKKSRVEEFKELIKNRNDVPSDVTAEVSSIITSLEKDNMNQLDFTRLPSKQSHLLNPQNKNLRKDFYLVWTNSENLRELLRNVLLQIDFFFRTYLLEITGSYVPEKDILYVLTSMSKEKLRISEHVSNQPQTIQVNLDVSDHPVSIPVYIANTILSAHDRTFASTKLNKIGCQYLYIHKHMLDSSTPTSSASEDLLDQEGQPLLKKMKTCQKAKYVKCDGDLKRHRENSCTLTENKLCVDVLIYCSSEKVNLNLAKYLGLISLEACIREADISANSDEVFEIRMDNKNAKTYRLAQAYVNRKLMMGYSNICLTCTYALFKYAQANVKACIFTKSDSTGDIVDFSARACFCVKIENEQNIVEFIAAVTNIINQVLKVKSSIKAVFCRSDDQLCKSFETTEIPLTCVVPLYILRYFSQVLISQSGLEELSYSSI